MKTTLPRRVCQFAALLTLACAQASDLDEIGVTTLRALHPELTGAGVIVAQPEADEGGGRYQVDPAISGQPSEKFTYYDTAHPYSGAGAGFVPALASGHANVVSANFYGLTAGASPGIEAIESFEAGYFYNGIVTPRTPIEARIVNQSFIFSTTDPTAIAQINRNYDAYANAHGTLFINGSNNGVSATLPAPASMFNGIAVGRTDGQHAGSVHIVAPGGATSFATPYVAGSAALLMQAADLGQAQALAGTNPSDARVIKSILLNGATKTETWTQTETNPLDPTTGVGVLNVNTSYQNFAGGQHAQTIFNRTNLGVISTSTNFSSSTPIDSLQGWDLTTLTARVNQDAVNHYFFDLSTEGFGSFTFTATATWNSRASGSSGSNLINNFDLALIDTSTQTVVTRSLSTTENVEHLYLTEIPSGTYDLQVILRGGAGTPSLSDTYALAFSFVGDATTAVPEPTTTAIWILGGLTALILLRHRRSTTSTADHGGRSHTRSRPVQF